MKLKSIILSILLSLFLLCTVLLSAVSFRFKWHPLVNLGLQYRMSTPNVDETFFDENFYKIIDLFVNEINQAAFENYGVDIDSEIIKNVLESPDNSYFINEFTKEVFRYFNSTKAQLHLNTNYIYKLINESYKRYLFETENKSINFDSIKINNNINHSSVEKVCFNFSDALDDLKKEKPDAFENVKFAELLFRIINYCLIVVCVLLAVILLILNKNIFILFRYLSISAIVDGILIIIMTNISGLMIFLTIYEFLWKVLPSVVNPAKFAIMLVYTSNYFLVKIRVFGLITVLCGVVLYLFGFKTEMLKSLFIKLTKRFKKCN